MFGRKVFFTSLTSKFWRFFYLKRVANHHLPLSAFTTYGRVLSPPFSASASSNELLLSLSGFVTLTWMVLALFSSPYFISCKETLPYKCDLGEHCSYTTNEMLAEVHDFHITLSYVIPKTY